MVPYLLLGRLGVAASKAGQESERRIDHSIPHCGAVANLHSSPGNPHEC
jgi:hypothetical protein